MWDFMAAAGPGLPPEAGRLQLDSTGRAIWRFVHKGVSCYMRCVIVQKGVGSTGRAIWRFVHKGVWHRQWLLSY
jgi:hypothetical protein